MLRALSLLLRVEPFVPLLAFQGFGENNERLLVLSGILVVSNWIAEHLALRSSLTTAVIVWGAIWNSVMVTLFVMVSGSGKWVVGGSSPHMDSVKGIAALKLLTISVVLFVCTRAMAAGIDRLFTKLSTGKSWGRGQSAKIDRRV